MGLIQRADMRAKFDGHLIGKNKICLIRTSTGEKYTGRIAAKQKANKYQIAQKPKSNCANKLQRNGRESKKSSIHVT